MNEPDGNVLVVGAGPVGLTMAAELARHGVRPRIVERLKSPSPYCRAIGVTTRTLEIWDDMGIVRPMIDAGLWLTGMRSIVDGQVQDSQIDLSDLPYATLGLPQYETERILARHLGGFGVSIEREVTLDTLTQSNGQVEATLIDAAGRRETSTFRYVIGCDGAHSAVRRALDIPFEGTAFPYDFMLGDVRIDWDLPRGFVLMVLRPIPDGPPDMFIAVPLPEPGRYRVSMIAPPELAASLAGTGHGIQSERPAPGIEPLQAVADRLLPEKVPLSDLRWSSIYRISMRLADRYRKGNVFIAGDAAHIHPPTGGQGMNTGIQDAYNLAWKLALVLNGAAPESLLDSYEAERRPVGEEVVSRTTEASKQLGRERREASRLADTQVLVHYRNSPWVHNAASASGQIAGPIAGDRVPDCQPLHRQGVGHPVRLFDILRGTEHVLLAYSPAASAFDDAANFIADARREGLLRTAAIVEPGASSADVPGWPTYIDSTNQFRQTVGAAPTCLLVRPDGYLAWRGERCSDAGLANVLDRTLHRGRNA